MLWSKLFLIFQACLLGFEIQLKPDHLKSIIYLIVIAIIDVIAILPTLKE
jgi:hypothetical protein